MAPLLLCQEWIVWGQEYKPWNQWGNYCSPSKRRQCPLDLDRAVEVEIIGQIERYFVQAWFFPFSLPSLFLFWLSFLGEESSLCFCQGYVLWRTDGLWNSSQESHWTAPDPQGFLESIQQWQFISNQNNKELITFASEYLLAITLFVTPTYPMRWVGERNKDFYHSFIVEVGELIGILEITKKKDVGLGIRIRFLDFWESIPFMQNHTTPQTYSFANYFPLKAPE